MIKITDKDLPELAKKYNSDGKTALYRYMQDKYRIKNPSCVFNRLKKESSLGYNQDIDKFTFVAQAPEKELFMTIEELCGKDKEEVSNNTLEERKIGMDKLIRELIEDRLLELSKYVFINTISRTMTIDKKALERDGYQVGTT